MQDGGDGTTLTGLEVTSAPPGKLRMQDLLPNLPAALHHVQCLLNHVAEHSQCLLHRSHLQGSGLESRSLDASAYRRTKMVYLPRSLAPATCISSRHQVLGLVIRPRICSHRQSWNAIGFYLPEQIRLSRSMRKSGWPSFLELRLRKISPAQ